MCGCMWLEPWVGSENGARLAPSTSSSLKVSLLVSPKYPLHNMAAGPLCRREPEMLPLLGLGSPCQGHWPWAGVDAWQVQVLASLRYLACQAGRNSVPPHFSLDLAPT